MVERTIKDLKKEIYLTLHTAQSMLELTEDGFMKNKLSALDQADELAKELHAKQDALTASLAKSASADIEARALLAATSHIEIIAANIKRINEGCRARVKEGLLFSDKGIREAGKLFAKAIEILKKAGEATVTGAAATVESTLIESDAIRRMATEFATAHEERLMACECSPKTSSTYLGMLYAFEDMGAHVKDAMKKLSGKK
jgi:Na+/phosphate symporter